MEAPLSAENALPLAGKHVVITRPLDQDEDVLQCKLRTWGARVSLIPLVEICLTDWYSEKFAFNIASEAFDWLFFTSRNAVNGFFQPLSQEAKQAFASIPIAVVGPATGQALEAYGTKPTFISPKYDAESAANAFRAAYDCAGLRLLWPCGNLANQQLHKILNQGGASVSPLVVYETITRKALSVEEVASLSSGVDMVVFTSPSAVSALAELSNSMDFRIHNTAIACLGPKTAEAARESFGHVECQAEPVTLEALADAIKMFCMAQEPEA